ncbi:TauD/TfdA family dioxygenase [Mesorhizobium mediterraneum]|uniref:TauD/TfdA family dioxygenase n=1 Tax=Mesorhizobium mediterraneum TaxID=43617 RepID=UPI00177A7632|nr:TauD/TfdA family dioxygenase [Mesorhizobium mediterraneum]
MTSTSTDAGTGFRRIQPKPVTITRESLARTSSLAPGFGLVIEASMPDLNLAAWAAASRDFIDAMLAQHGALLLRGFAVKSAADFRQFAEAASSELLDYSERAAPRTEVSSKVFTSTAYPASASIPLHHEMSYSHNWPSRIFFYCSIPPGAGGRTPIADDRRIYDLIPERIKQRFLRHRVMYVRNYGQGVDLRWQEAFQTEDRTVVEAYCRNAGAQFIWLDGDRLRTRQIRQVVAICPGTETTVWFNHAHLFHHSSLAPDVARDLLSMFGEEELPRNVFYGDGSPIETDVLDEIRAIYEREAVRFDWQQGDVLMLDNFRVSHGREPFVAPREILVVMADLFSNPQA